MSRTISIESTHSWLAFLARQRVSRSRSRRKEIKRATLHHSPWRWTQVFTKYSSFLRDSLYTAECFTQGKVRRSKSFSTRQRKREREHTLSAESRKFASPGRRRTEWKGWVARSSNPEARLSARAWPFSFFFGARLISRASLGKRGDELRPIAAGAGLVVNRERKRFHLIPSRDRTLITVFWNNSRGNKLPLVIIRAIWKADSNIGSDDRGRDIRRLQKRGFSRNARRDLLWSFAFVERYKRQRNEREGN